MTNSTVSKIINLVAYCGMAVFLFKFLGKKTWKIIKYTNHLFLFAVTVLKLKIIFLILAVADWNQSANLFSFKTLKCSVIYYKVNIVFNEINSIIAKMCAFQFIIPICFLPPTQSIQILLPHTTKMPLRTIKLLSFPLDYRIYYGSKMVNL